MNFQLKINTGLHINGAIQQASTIAKDKGVLVEFYFNNCKVLVDKHTNVSLLSRDFLNLWMYLDYGEIGPDCEQEYSPEILKALADKKQEIETRRQKEAEIYEQESLQKLKSFQEKVGEETIDLISPTIWEEGKIVNSDGYGKGIYTYGECWAKLMQVEIKAGNKLENIAEKTSNEADLEGITGFMYGAAVSILSQTWVYGKLLNDWHNAQYNHSGNGTVNPALLTIKS